MLDQSNSSLMLFISKLILIYVLSKLMMKIFEEKLKNKKKYLQIKSKLVSLVLT